MKPRQLPFDKGNRTPMENTMKKFLFLATIPTLILALVPLNAGAQAGHEYSPLVEKTVNYKNWSLMNVKTDTPEDLRTMLKGKKLAMVVYFALWCGNWRNEAPIAAKLYEKYKDQGFQVIGVSEYAARADVKAFFGEAGPPYPIVSESETRDNRDKTPH